MRKGIGVVALVAVVLALTWVVPRIGVPSQFWFAPLESVSVDGRELRVVRVGYAQGLREMDSFGTLDAALFVMDQPASPEAGMGMYDTLMPLDVVFFDSSGRFIIRYTMPVCPDESCPTFFPTRPWQFAIEAPAGSLAWVPTDAQMER